MGGRLDLQHVTDVERFVSGVGTRLDGSPLALMFDIDGTLSPIAPTPAEAGVPEQTRDVLRRLALLPRVILALVSGRSAEDAWRLAGFSGAWVIGNHGLELRTPDGEITASDEVQEFDGAVEEAAGLLRSLEQSNPGAIVENKRWTLSLHYRLVAPQAVPALIARAREVANATGLRVTEGKKIVELRPPVSVDKGTATIAFAERHGALDQAASVLYAGDDRTDEDAFAQLKDRSSRAVTVRVLGPDDRGDEPTGAEFTLASPRELQQVLEWLAERRGRA